MGVAGKTTRRQVLEWGAATGLTGGLLAVSKTANAQSISGRNEVQAYRRLGRTDFEISDISMGTSSLRHGQEDLVRYALDSGINYFDSAISYARGQSEEVLGRALKDVRDKVYIVSKVVSRADSSKEWLMSQLDTSLRRLQTDYVDVYMCHAVNEVERLSSPDWNEFITKAKEQGKVRFAGMSGHAGYLAQCLEYALDQDMADVVLVAYNFGADPKFYEGLTRRQDWIATQPELPRLLTKAKAQDVGVTVMKTLRGARLNDMRPYETEGSTYAQAAFRWVLSNKNVDAVVVTMGRDQQVNEYLGASGAAAVAIGDRNLLERYVHLNDSSYCRHNCNACYSACPYNVEIGEVLRTRMYAADYKDVVFAKEQYAEIATNAQACLTCYHQTCANACTYGVPIAELCGPTHNMLA